MPNTYFNGTISSAITFRAWDQSVGTNGGTWSTTVNGGSSAFSATSDTATQVVTFVNQAPSFTKGADQSVASNGGPQNLTAWATNISPGAPTNRDKS